MRKAIIAALLSLAALCQAQTGSEALTGRVHFFMAPIANSVSHVRDGRLVGLGVSSLKRDPRSRWLPIGIEPGPTTPEELDRLVRDEIALFINIARAANIRAE